MELVCTIWCKRHVYLVGINLPQKIKLWHSSGTNHRKCYKRGFGFCTCPTLDTSSCYISVPFSGVCAPNEFQCEDGFCIPSVQQCNGVLDCADRSDESNCRKEPQTFMEWIFFHFHVTVWDKHQQQCMKLLLLYVICFPKWNHQSLFQHLSSSPAQFCWQSVLLFTIHSLLPASVLFFTYTQFPVQPVYAKCQQFLFPCNFWCTVLVDCYSNISFHFSCHVTSYHSWELSLSTIVLSFWRQFKKKKMLG